MTQDKRKKKPWKKYIMFVLSIVVPILIGGAIGLWGAENSRAMGGGEMPFPVVLLWICAIIFITFILHIFIHEAGHLVFGLLTGYRFLSFRIGDLMWIKENGRLKVKRLSIAGTGGQCLLLPPESSDENVPFVLYNLGGSILNVVSGLLFFVLYLFFKDIEYLSEFLFLLSIIGIIFALLNGIPMKNALVSNDGYNARTCAKDSKALRAFLAQMRVVGQISNGVRLKDMPEEWFSFTELEEMNDVISVTIGVFAENRLMDSHRFDEADQLAKQLFALESLAGLHRNLLLCDRIYCELIGENRRDVLDIMRDEKQKKFMQSMKKFPSVLRTEYVYMLLAEKNTECADKIIGTFEKVARTYPYSCDIESERELIEIAKQKIVQ